MGFTGYVRIEDTYHPEEYRIGIPAGGLEIDTEAAGKIGRFTVQFNCKPQRFLKTGEISTRYTEGTKLFNPTGYPARPLIRICGHGSLGIGEDTVTIRSHSFDYIDLDCETCDASCGSLNANGSVVLSGDDYPVLKAGTTGIVLGNGITAVEIAPRWWML